MPDMGPHFQALAQDAAIQLDRLEKTQPTLLTDGMVFSHYADTGHGAPQIVNKPADGMLFMYNEDPFFIRQAALGALPEKNMPGAIEAISHFSDLAGFLPRGDAQQDLYRLQADHLIIVHRYDRWANPSTPVTDMRSMRQSRIVKLTDAAINALAALPPAARADIANKFDLLHPRRRKLLATERITYNPTLVALAQHILDNHADRLPEQGTTLRSALTGYELMQIPNAYVVVGGSSNLIHSTARPNP